MKILLASSEVHPFSKTGGLADMVGALGKALVRAGHEARIVTPLYRGIAKNFRSCVRWTGSSICRWARNGCGQDCGRWKLKKD
jgi:starch synthase